MFDKKHPRQYFDEIAKGYDKLAFDGAGLIYLSNFETCHMRKLANRRKKGLYLDCGIGTGRNSEIILEGGHKVIGIDVSKEMIRMAKTKLQRFETGKQIIYKVHDLNNPIPFSSDMFDGVICIRVIKYVIEWQNLLRELARVIKPGGIFVLEISNKNSIQFFSSSYSHYYSMNSRLVEEELKKNHFILLNKAYGAKLPFYIYKYFRSKKALWYLVKIENILLQLLGKNFSRNIIYICKK